MTKKKIFFASSIFHPFRNTRQLREQWSEKIDWLSTPFQCNAHRSLSDAIHIDPFQHRAPRLVSEAMHLDSFQNYTPHCYVCLDYHLISNSVQKSEETKKIPLTNIISINKKLNLIHSLECLFFHEIAKFIRTQVESYVK